MLLRERVRDAVEQLSYGDHEYGIQSFAKRACELGAHAGLKLWSDRTIDMQRSAVNSLKTLLGDYTSGDRRGVNEHWVLDLWELVLHEHYRGPVRIVRPEPTTPAVAESGVVVFADKKREKQTEKLLALPMRLLEAYMARDDETFMGLLLEVETIGKES
jgi:hypothetical protein